MPARKANPQPVQVTVPVEVADAIIQFAKSHPFEAVAGFLPPLIRARDAGANESIARYTAELEQDAIARHVETEARARAIAEAKATQLAAEAEREAAQQLADEAQVEAGPSVEAAE